MQAGIGSFSISSLSRLRHQELIERHALRLIFLGLLAFSLAGLLYLTETSAAVTTGYEIEKLQREKERLRRERDRLRAEIAVLTAPARIEARARALGFEPPTRPEYLAIRELPHFAHQMPPGPVNEIAPNPVGQLLAQGIDGIQSMLGTLTDRVTRRVEARSLEP